MNGVRVPRSWCVDPEALRVIVERAELRRLLRAVGSAMRQVAVSNFTDDQHFTRFNAALNRECFEYDRARLIDPRTEAE